MARPRTPIGTFGEIEFTKLPNGTTRARTRFRDYDGQLRRIEASGDTRTRAEHQLTEKLAARSGYTTGFGELTPDSPFTQLVEVWLEDLDLEGKLAESTQALYERNMRQLVMPTFENLLLREISVRKVDQFIKRLASAKSYSTAKQARTVLSLALGLAVRYDALRENPVRDTAPLHKPPSEAMALTLDQAHFGRAHADPVRRSPAAVPARTSRPRAGQLAAAGRLISYKSDSSRHANLGAPKAKERPMGKVVMYSSVSVDGFIADENDQPGSLFDWLSSGDVPLDESGELKVSQTSYDYTRPYWDQIGATIVGRHVFDMTDGWDGKPPGGIDHVVVVTHRPKPEGWDPEAPFHFVDGVEAAVAKAQELAGDRMVEVAAGDVGGQVLAAGLIDEVRMDVVPVVFGSGKRYFGSVHAQHLLEDPDVVIQGNRVLHLRYRVRR
jgi:dihydrofolate reductase